MSGAFGRRHSAACSTPLILLSAAPSRGLDLERGRVHLEVGPDGYSNFVAALLESESRWMSAWPSKRVLGEKVLSSAEGQ
jgi:hypothetical protein